MANRLRKLLKWAAAALIVLVAFGYFVIRPLAERALHGAGAFLGAIAAGAAEVAQTVYTDASQRVEQSAEVQALLGDLLVCAPIEDVQWLPSQDPKRFEFKFKVSGPQGDGEVHVTAEAGENALVITNIDVAGPSETIALPLAP